MAVAHKAWMWYTRKADQAEVQRLLISWRVVRRGAWLREKASPVILVDLSLAGNSLSCQYFVLCHNRAGKDGSSEGEVFFGRCLFYCIFHLLSTYSRVNSRAEVSLGRTKGTIARCFLTKWKGDTLASPHAAFAMKRKTASIFHREIYCALLRRAAITTWGF